MGEHPNERHQIVDLDFLRGLIAAIDDSGIDSLEISRGGTRIRVAKTPPQAPGGNAGAGAGQSGAPMYAHVTPAPAASTAAATEPASAAAPTAASNLVDVTSPMVGTFYRAPAPEAPPYVEVGSKVVKGQTLCILEAMKLMNELEAEVEGVVREICIESAEPVEYGQVLFRIEPEE
ncbi:MAG: acetyl-CoA carboxylase biotin carboxyl carrier protein [Gemmatimonas sp.]|nr:acetyl-CoA carboxylase biotin carboxyl carrier protein [Gemmatimonas sp.]